jgi:hypothetical protein
VRSLERSAPPNGAATALSSLSSQGWAELGAFPFPGPVGRLGPPGSLNIVIGIPFITRRLYHDLFFYRKHFVPDAGLFLSWALRIRCTGCIILASRRFAMAATEQAQPDEKSAPNRVARGPSYPSLSLEEAVGKAREFWDAEKRSAAPVSAAARHWGYSVTSSSGKVVVAALLQYGLLEDSGSKDNRMVKLTPRALDILLDEVESPGRLKAIQDAARSPKIYSDLLAKWPPNELPSDQTIKFFLLRDKGFNEGSVVGFLKDFRGTLTYAKLDKTPRIEVNDAPETELGTDLEERTARVQDKDPVVNATQERAAVTLKPLPPASGVKQDTFSLDEGQVVLQFPEKMSSDSYEDFKDWIELQLRKIKRSIPSASSGPQQPS